MQRNCTELELLHLQDTWVDDIAMLTKFTSIKELALDAHDIKNKAVFKQLDKVDTINGEPFVEFIPDYLEW